MAAKRYLYKVYKAGVFSGVLPDVVSDFSYSQDINTAGPQLTITLATTLTEAGATETIETVQDDSGSDVTDEFGQSIYSSLVYDFTNTPIDLGNRIVVYAYYDDAVNGIVVFDGLVSTWEVDTVAGTITLTVLSYGVQLDNYLIAVVPGTAVVGQTQREFLRFIYSASPDGSAYQIADGQTFQLTADTKVAGINLRIAKDSAYAGTPTARLTLQSGTPDSGSSVISSVARPVINDELSVDAFVLFTFPTPVDLLASTTYSFTVTVENTPSSTHVSVGYKGSDVFSSGQEYYKLSTTGWTSAANDLVFQVIAGEGNAYGNYLSQDPSEILRSILDNYQGFGGIVDYSTTSIDNTGTTVTYAFKGNTVFEGVRKVLELAPANWYWYVDPGTNLLHFHRSSPIAQHTFYNGKHLTAFKLGNTLDEMKNIVYFSGGDTGAGINLVRQDSNTSSTTKYGNWLQRESDNRVTLDSTAATISRSIINQFSSPVFRTEIEVASAVYDIETINLGDMVAFRGFDSFTNSLLLQVAGVSRTKSTVKLRLATNPPSVAHRIEDIRRNLDNLYTVANPTT